MVRKTFNAKLRSVKSKFRWVIEMGALRGYAKSKKVVLKDFDFCPITAVHYALNGEALDCGDFDKAADALGLSRIDASVIVSIADTKVDYLDGNEILARNWLLKNVGLKPEVRSPKENL